MNTKRLRIVLALMLVLIVSGAPACAGTYTWIGKKDWGLWSNKENWQGGVIPNYYDTAVFPADARVKLDKDVTVANLQLAGGATLDLMGVTDLALCVRTYDVTVTPGTRRAVFTQGALDASKAKALKLTGTTTARDDSRLSKSGLIITPPTGRTIIGENSKIVAGRTSLSTGADSWLRPEGNILAGEFVTHNSKKSALIMTDDLAAHGLLTLDGTLTFNGDEGGFLAYPDSSFTLNAGGAILSISGGDYAGRTDSVEDPLNGIELTHASLTSGRAGVLLTGRARAYGVLKMRGNLIFASGSSLTNYDSDGFTLYADGRPVMICIDGAEVGTGLNESFLIMRGGSNLLVNATTSREAGITNSEDSLIFSGVDFSLEDDMPCSGKVTFDGSMRFTEGGLIVYPKMTFTLKASDGSILSIAGGDENDNYDDPLNGLELDDSKLICNSDGISIDGKAQGFGQLKMCGTLILETNASLGNYDHDNFILKAGDSELKVRARIDESTFSEGVTLRPGGVVIFQGAETPNKNRLEDWGGMVSVIGRVKGMESEMLTIF